MNSMLLDPNIISTFDILYITMVLCCLCGAVILSLKITGRILSPLTTISIGWPFLSISNLFSVDYKISKSTMLIIFASYLTYIMGFLIVFLSNAKVFCKYKNNYISGVQLNELRQNYSPKILKKMIYTLAVPASIATMLGVMNVIKEGGWSLFLAAGHRAIETTFAFWTGTTYLYFLFGVIIYLIIMYFSLYRIEPKLLLIMAFGIFGFFVHGVKGNLIFVSIISGFTYLLNKEGLSIKKIFIILISAWSIFTVLAATRDIATILVNKKGILDVAYDYGVTRFLHYLIPNFSNLEAYFQHKNEHAWGLYLFSKFYMMFIAPFMGFNKIQAYSLFEDVLGDIPYKPIDYFVSEHYIIETWLADIFIDFGIAGCIIVPFMLGFIAALITVYYYKSANIFSTFLFVLVNLLALFSFWSNEYVRFNFIYWVLIIYLLHRISKKKAFNA